MAKIFLSYSGDSREYARVLKVELEKHGHASWWFDEGLPAGASWQDEIMRSISEVDVIVILLTDRAHKSAWINHELGMAVAYARERGRPLIIPVSLGQTKLPVNLERYQCIFDSDMDAIQTAARIADGINAYFGRQKAEQDAQKQVKAQIEKSASDFVSGALSALRKRETDLRRSAYIWYGLSYVTLLVTVIIGVWRAWALGQSQASWQTLLQTGLSGLIVVVLMLALSKYSFTLGKSFMVESLRNADRCHAISFGEFYLKAYGEKSSSREIMEAFKDWNIDKGSFFFSQTPEDFDPHLMQVIVEIAKALSQRKQ